MVLENFIVDAPIVWDRVGKKIFENPHVKQGRKMRVQITNAGMVEDLNGYTLALGWKHTVSGIDGLDVFEDSSEANVGIFEMAYTENLMTNLGNLKASLVLTSVEDMVVAESNDFYVKVDTSPFGADAEQGVGSYTRLAEILLNEESRIAAEVARVSAEETRVTDFNALVDSEIIAQNVATKLQAKEAEYLPRLVSNEQQLAEAATKAELDETNVSVNLKADKTYVDTKIATVVSGSPKGVYATLALLQSAFPTGNTNVYVVSADGHWYYWNGTTWTSGGVYQAEKLADNSVLLKNLSDDIVKKIHNIKDYSVASNALTDFTAVGTTALSLDGVYIKALSSGEPVTFKQYKDWGLPIGDKILVTFKVRANKSGNIIMYLLTNNVGGVLASTTQSISENERTVSVVMSGPTLCNGIYFDCNDFTTSGDYVEILDLVVADLSPVFGIGNEPTANEARHYMWSSNNKYTDIREFLLADSIQGAVVYVVKGTNTYTLTHNVLLSDINLVLRTDVITISGIVVTEVRTAFTGDVVTITTNTTTLSTEVA